MTETAIKSTAGDLEALWRRYLATGDEEVMERVVKRTRPRLLAAARRIGRPGDAEDCVQSAYLSLLRRGAAVRDVPVYPWLLTAVIRLAYRRKARERRETELARRLAIPGRFTVAMREELGGDEAELLRRAVEELPDKYRDAVVLHYFQGLSTPETARVLAIEPGALRVRLHRARSILRERWGRRTAHALLILPLSIRDRVRAWHASGFVGAIGLAKLPGLVAAVFLGAVAIGAGATATAVGLGSAPAEVSPIEVSPSASIDARGRTSSPTASSGPAEGDLESASAGHIVVEDHYLNGALKSRREVVRDRSGESLNDGKFESWRPDGSRESVGRYTRGRRTGKWTFFHENGERAEEGRYEDDQETGLWTEWSESGKKVAQAEYAKGLRHGHGIGWHESGQKASEGEYVAGGESGTWEFWEVSGRLVEKARFQEGSYHGLRELFWENGSRSEWNYDDGELHGDWVDYYPGGNVQRRMQYRQGEQHGVSVYFYAAGKKQSEGHFDAGVSHGPVKAWHPNGAVASSGGWDHGRQDGTWTFHSEHGVKTQEMTYSKGRFAGPQILWNEKGVKVHETRFGLKPGEMTTLRLWYDDGSPALVQQFPRDDRVVVRRAWDTDGRSYEVTMENGRIKTGEWLEIHSLKRVKTRLQAFADFLQHGPELNWSLSGALIRECGWQYGKKHGRWREWNADGDLEVDQTWENGVRVEKAEEEK